MAINEDTILRLRDFSSSQARRGEMFIDINVTDKIHETLAGKSILEFPTIKIDSWAGGNSAVVKQPPTTES